MKGLIINLSGSWAHFKKVDTNNNPLTHDFITKTALIGLIGAVNGIIRSEMKSLFPQLSEDILYGVALNSIVKKESWGFTLRSIKVNTDKSPWQFEFLKSPRFTVAIALKNERSGGIFEVFKKNVENERSCFNPTFGLANCPAEIKFVTAGTFSERKSGSFETTGFVSSKHEIVMDENSSFRIGFEKIPTYQNDDFWNLPDRYLPVGYPDAGSRFKVRDGEYFDFKANNENSQWFLI